MQVLKRTLRDYETVFLDGCAIVWIIPWPHNGIVRDFAESFVQYISCLLSKVDVYLIFDRYYTFSTKSCTRQGKAKNISRAHALGIETPLPPQKEVLMSTANKTQMIEIITKYLLEHFKREIFCNKFVVTSSVKVPDEICSGMHKKIMILEQPKGL